MTKPMMMRVVSLLGIFLLSFLTLVASVLGQETPHVSEVPKSLEIIENYGVVDQELVKAERRLYLYLPADEFQLNSVKMIVDKFRQNFPKPDWLEITIYSDREALVKKAKGDRLPFYVDFPNTKEGIFAAVKFREKIYGKEFGFMRAVYTRYNGNESLDYSKSADDKILTRETWPIMPQQESSNAVEVLENWVSTAGQSGIKDRQIFILIPERLFSPERVAALFDKYQRKFCDPYILMIFVFTDRNALKKQFAYETKTTVFVDFADTEEGRKAALEYYNKLLPPQTGYFRAEYSRYGDYEQYSYMTAKDSPLTTRVILRSPEKMSLEPNICKNPLRPQP